MVRGLEDGQVPVTVGGIVIGCTYGGKSSLSNGLGHPFETSTEVKVLEWRETLIHIHSRRLVVFLLTPKGIREPVVYISVTSGLTPVYSRCVWTER